MKDLYFSLSVRFKNTVANQKRTKECLWWTPNHNSEHGIFGLFFAISLMEEDHFSIPAQEIDAWIKDTKDPINNSRYDA